MNNHTNTLVCKILGVDPKGVASLNLELKPDSLAQVTIVRYVLESELTEITERFYLVPVDETPKAGVAP